MSKPHAFCHDQEPVDINLLPTKKTVWRHKGKSYPSLTFPWLKHRTEVPYQFFDKIILVHSEQNSKDIEFLKDDGYIPVHWFNHAILARDWFRYAEVDPVLNTYNQFKKKFLIYNRAWTGSREYRLWFAEQLVRKQLHHHCKTSLSYREGCLHYKDYLCLNDQWKISTPDLEFHLPNNIHNSASSADYVNKDYVDTAMEVVLETIFDSNKIFITEKTLRPIATGRPFMIMGGPGSLAYLRSYGFETFSPWINEEYDNIVDPMERAKTIIAELQRLNNMFDSDFFMMINACNQIAKRNRERFFSQDFFQQVINEFTQGMQSAILEATQHVSTTNWDVWAKDQPVVPDVAHIKKQLGLN